MSLDFIDDQSTLVQVMAWGCQATSHYLGQCWPRSLKSYGVTRPQWFNSQKLCGDSYVHYRTNNNEVVQLSQGVNSSPPGQNGCHFADDILQCIFLNENCRILIINSLKFVPTDLINMNDIQATSHCLTNDAGIILCIHPANERRRYNVTLYLIGWINALGGCIVYCHIYPSVNTILQK